MKHATRSLLVAILFVPLIIALSGCPHRRPDELEFAEIWRFKNLVVSSNPEFTHALMPHPDFTYENVMWLREGTRPNDVEAVFGPPDKTRFQIFGLSSPDPWRGIVFEYCMGYHFEGKYSKNSNILVFSAEHSPPRLEYWDIQMIYKEHPPRKATSENRTFLP